MPTLIAYREVPIRFARVSRGGPAPTPPATPPTVTLLGPSPASLAATTPLRFSVDSATLKTIVWIYYPGLQLEEVVWDGSAFSEAYRSSSTREVAGTLETFSVRRAPAWPEAPTLRVFAAAGGAEAT